MLLNQPRLHSLLPPLTMLFGIVMGSLDPGMGEVWNMMMFVWYWVVLGWLGEHCVVPSSIMYLVYQGWRLESSWEGSL